MILYIKIGKKGFNFIVVEIISIIKGLIISYLDLRFTGVITIFHLEIVLFDILVNKATFS